MKITRSTLFQCFVEPRHHIDSTGGMSFKIICIAENNQGDTKTFLFECSTKKKRSMNIVNIKSDYRETDNK